MFRAKIEMQWVLISTMMLGGQAFGQQPRLSSVQPVIRSAARGLEQEFRTLAASQTTAVWIGYTVPAIPGDHGLCCGNSGSAGCCNKCLLESEGQSADVAKNGSRVSLESAGSLQVLFRVDQHQVQKIRSFSGDCELDTGGLTLFWLTEVRSNESTALLASFVTGRESEDPSKHELSEGALAAIAFHSDDSADRVLESFVSPGRTEYLREKTSFWLGVARAGRGYQLLRGMLRTDPSDKVRGQVIFALSLSRDPDAVGTMIEAAKSDKSEHVRGQALFWLAQKAGKKAVDAIANAVENDPETEVKKKAVFALSQLPADDGVPRLIQIARSHNNPAVRKQAIFWLGQSGDSRALTFFEEILAR